MMAAEERRTAVLVSSSARAAVESFESKRARQVNARASKRLTEAEAEDLRYLWHGYESDLGIRSVHGAIERQLLIKAPPRDLQEPVLEELERAKGRAPEGRILRIVTSERWGTRREVRLAIEYLTRPHGRRGPRVERIPVDQPETPSTCELRRTGRACSHPCSSCEWTGYDLKLTERARGEIRMQLALASVPKSREQRRAESWAAQDAALEREWRILAVKGEAHGAPTTRDGLSKRQRAAVNRAMTALAMLTRQQATVLELVYGSFHAVEDLELATIAAKFKVTKPRAAAMRDDACEAYRKARRGA